MTENNENDSDRKNEKHEVWEYFSNFLAQKYVISIVLLVYISNMVGGFCFAWSSPILVKLKETENNPLGYPISADESDLTASLFSIGAAAGPLLFIRCLQTLGRKTTIVIMSLPVPIVYGLLALATHIQVFYICRVVLGCVMGGIFSTVPIYISEISPRETRGSFMSLSNTFILSGSLLTYCIGPYLSFISFNLVIAILSLVYLVLFILGAPESPYYIMQKREKDKANKILFHLRKSDTDIEINDIENSVNKEIENSYWNIVRSKKNVKAFSMATTLLIIQQFTGINIVIGYSQQIFLGTNIRISSEKCSIIVGTLQVISSLSLSLLVEKFKRKTMLCFSLLGLSVCNFSMFLYFFILKDMGGVDWLPLITLVYLVIFDNCGNGALPWVILGEIFPMEIKSIGPAVSTSIAFFVQFLMMFSFNKIEMKYMFFGYGLCCILGIIYVQLCITETRGKSLREIREELEGKPLNNKNVNA